MKTSNNVADRVTRSNPSPSDTPLPESTWDAATLLEVIDRRSGSGNEAELHLVDDTTPSSEAGRRSTRSRWRGPVVAFGAAVVVLLIATLTVLVTGRQEPIDPTDTQPPVTEPFTTEDVEVGSWQLPPSQIGRRWLWVFAISQGEVEINGRLSAVEDGELDRAPLPIDSSWSLGIDADGIRWTWDRIEDGQVLHYRMTDPDGRSRTVPLPEVPARKRAVAARSDWLRIGPDGAPWAFVQTERVGAPRSDCLDAFKSDGSAWVLTVSCEQIPRIVPKARRTTQMKARVAPGIGDVLWVATNEATGGWVLHRVEADVVDTYPLQDGDWDIWGVGGSPWYYPIGPSVPTGSWPDPWAFYWGGLTADAEGRVWQLRSSESGLNSLASLEGGTWTSHGSVVAFTVAPDGTPWVVAEEPEERHLPSEAEAALRDQPTLTGTQGATPHRRPTVLWFDGQAWRPVWEGTGRCYTPHERWLAPSCTISVAPDGTVWLGQATAVGKGAPKKRPDAVIRLVGIDAAGR